MLRAPQPSPWLLLQSAGTPTGAANPTGRRPAMQLCALLAPPSAAHAPALLPCRRASAPLGRRPRDDLQSACHPPLGPGVRAGGHHRRHGQRRLSGVSAAGLPVAVRLGPALKGAHWWQAGRRCMPCRGLPWQPAARRPAPIKPARLPVLRPAHARCPAPCPCARRAASMRQASRRVGSRSAWHMEAQELLRSLPGAAVT